MYAGDTALVSMQYSYLPSWISFLVDRSKVAETGAGADHRRARTLGWRCRRRPGRSCCCSARAWARTAPSRRFGRRPRWPTARTACCWSARRSPTRSATRCCRRPRPRQPGLGPGATASSRSSSRRDPADLRAPPGAPEGGLPAELVRPDRLVEPGPAVRPAGVAGRAARAGRVPGHALVSRASRSGRRRRPVLRQRRAGRPRPRLRLRRGGRLGRAGRRRPAGPPPTPSALRQILDATG